MTRTELYMIFMTGYSLGSVMKKATDEELKECFDSTIKALNG